MSRQSRKLKIKEQSMKKISKKHQIAIALAALKAPAEMLAVMGGMDKKQAVAYLESINRLPVICYDNGGKTIDRYTVVFRIAIHNIYGCLAMSDNPASPNGFCQHSECVLGDHLGERISFYALPIYCQTAVRRDLEQ
jgi:hypothetical protein